MRNWSETKSNPEKVSILIIMRDKFFQDLYQSRLEEGLRESINLFQVTSFTEARDCLAKIKSSLDFAVIPSFLEDTKVDTMQLSQEIRSQSNATLIATGNQRKKLVGADKCQLECSMEELAQFLYPLIEERIKELENQFKTGVVITPDLKRVA